MLVHVTAHGGMQTQQGSLQWKLGGGGGWLAAPGNRSHIDLGIDLLLFIGGGGGGGGEHWRLLTLTLSSVATEIICIDFWTQLLEHFIIKGETSFVIDTQANNLFFFPA